MLPDIASSGNGLVPSSSQGSQSLSSDFPMDRQSSSCGSAGVGSSSSLYPAVPRVSFGSQPGTTGISGTSRENIFPFLTILRTMTVREDDEPSSSDKEDFSKDFQEIIGLIVGYFPNWKSSASINSMT